MSNVVYKKSKVPVRAGDRYFTEREQYRAALRVIATIAEEDMRKLLSTAATARVRRQFRGVSEALTAELGCRLSCVAAGHPGPTHVEHAVPLNLIHNRILGIQPTGAEDPQTYDMFPTPESIEAFVQPFMVGVLVTPEQHRMLKARAMHGEWTWLDDMSGWNWSELDLERWNPESRPLWLRLIMNRYEHVGPPDGPIPYHPIRDSER